MRRILRALDPRPSARRARIRARIAPPLIPAQRSPWPPLNSDQLDADQRGWS